MTFSWHLMYIYIYNWITCVCGGTWGIMCLTVINVTMQKYFFYFDLKWNMTLQCSLLVNEIYETFLNCPFPAMISPVKRCQLNAHRPVMHIMPVCCRVIFSRSQDLRWFLQETLCHCECVWLEALIWWDSALASRSCFVIFSLWSLNMFILLVASEDSL